MNILNERYFLLLKWVKPSPYSLEVNQALRTVFSVVDCEKILEYGWKHPEIVLYMNAYADEDPKIAYSLVSGIGTRSLVTDGTAYAITNIIPNSLTKVSTAVIRNATGSYKYIFGACGTAGKSSYYFLGANNNNWYNEVRGLNNNFGTANEGVHYVLEFTTSYTKVNGVIYGNGGTGILGTNNTAMTIGRAVFENGQMYDSPWIGSIDYLIIETNGINVGYFIPFNQNGVMYWLDLLTGQTATNVGVWFELIFI